ncbi:MAG: hypothetical protein HQ521_00055 [Bacteroidetes bacterium]|nr:hypothetical protein [Bacteroidota bacterium]
MKKILVSMLAIVLFVTVQAQHVFNKGSIMFNAGIGMPASNGVIPTINFSGEVGVIPTGNIGLVSFGGLAEFQVANYNWLGSNEVFPRVYFGPRAAWHVHAFNSDEFDAYAGVGLGISISGGTTHYGNDINFNPDVFVGGRWMFKSSLGLFAEAGYSGLSVLKFGITFGF